MNLQSFADELGRLHGGRSAMLKVAKAGFYGRMGSIGAASGLGGHLLQHGKALMTGDPYDEPQGTALGSALKAGLGGLSIGALMNLVAKARKA